MGRSGSTDTMMVPGGNAYRDFAIAILDGLRTIEGDGPAMLVLEGDALIREYASWTPDTPPVDPKRPSQWQDDIVSWGNRAGPISAAVRRARKR